MCSDFLSALSTVTAGQVAPSEALIKVKAAGTQWVRLISISLCSTQAVLPPSLWVTLNFFFVHRRRVSSSQRWRIRQGRVICSTDHPVRGAAAPLEKRQPNKNPPRHERPLAGVVATAALTLRRRRRRAMRRTWPIWFGCVSGAFCCGDRLPTPASWVWQDHRENPEGGAERGAWGEGLCITSVTLYSVKSAAWGEKKARRYPSAPV